jgi:hypothetical protein
MPEKFMKKSGRIKLVAQIILEIRRLEAIRGNGKNITL